MASLLLVTGALITGCSITVAGQPIAEGYVPPGLERFYAQTPQWGSCNSYATDQSSSKAFSSTDTQCARLTVPLDYSKPAGQTITLGLLRIPALVPAERIGSVVVNPGGPGESGMEAVVSMAVQASNSNPASDLLNRFDLIGFDPRGVGDSQPAIHCRTDAERDADRLIVPLDDPAKEAAREEAANQHYAQECAQRSGADALANVGTRDVAKDLDVLRAALGESQLTYLGFSYGTKIGTQYAEDFPKNVRAMILDGAVDPAESQNSADNAQGDGFGQAFDDFAHWCAKQSECGVGTNPDKANDKLNALSDPLKTNPVAVGDRKLSYSDIGTAVSSALYSEDDWKQLNQGLLDLPKGDGTILLQLADSYDERNDNGHYANTDDVFHAVNCVDYPQIKSRQTLIDQQRAADKAAGIDPNTDTNVPALDACAFWPVPNTSAPHLPKMTGLPQVLVISTTHDPATPYQSGVNLAKDLGARLLTFDGTQHTAYLQGDDCVDKAATNYLVQLTLPPDKTTCGQ